MYGSDGLNEKLPGAITSLTRICATAVLPSIVALIEAEPELTAVMTPVELTDTTSALLVVQDVARPLITSPDTLRAVAASGMLSPGFSVVSAGVSVTDATTARGSTGADLSDVHDESANALNATCRRR